MKYRVKDIPGLPSALNAEQDAIELGLQEAWRFVEHGTYEPSITKPLIEELRARGKAKEDKKLSLAANGPILGVLQTLLAIEDQTDRALQGIMSRTMIAVSRLVMGEIEYDEDLVREAQDAETRWQSSVVKRIVAHGDAPITRATFADLLEGQASWRQYLPSYAARWWGKKGAESNSAAQANAKKPAPAKKLSAKKVPPKKASKAKAAKKR